MRTILALLLSLWLAPALAQVPMTGAGKGTPAASYVGPGDTSVFGASGVVFWGSCARVFTAALASTSTSLCDLTAVVTQNGYTAGGAVCTLRATSTGFVDLAASYCNGTTPAAACGSGASGAGGCKVSKLYDQSGAGNHLLQTTDSVRPTLTFSSSPTGTLPVLTFAASINMVSSAITVSTPIVGSFVGVRTGGAANSGAIGSQGSMRVGGGNGSALAAINQGADVTQSTGVAENAWYSAVGYLNGASSVINAMGSETSGNAATNTWSATAVEIGRPAFAQWIGSIAEAGLWSSSSTSTTRNLIITNTRSSSGYNF